MTLATDIEQRIAAIRAHVARRHLEPADLARRLGVHPRTIRRLLDGRTRSPALVDAVARVLGLGDTRPTLPHVAPSRPVTSWSEAAVVLGVSRWTLQRWRRRAGDRRVRPWFADPQACQEWGRALAAGE